MAMEQYFTPEPVARECVSTLLREMPGARDKYHWVDAGAGRGALSDQLPSTVKSLCKVELDPHLAAAIGAECCDYLTWRARTPKRRTIVLTNPPYNVKTSGARERQRGAAHVSSTATKFVNHSLTIADTAACILTASWLRPDYLKHVRAPLILAKPLGVCKFKAGSQTKPVRVALLVWSRVFEEIDISVLPPPCSDSCDGIEFLTPDRWREANFVFNRWGRCGRIEPLDSPPSQTHLNHNLKNGGTRFYLIVSPEHMTAVKQTCDWIRAHWPLYSPGNNSNIGMKAFNGVHVHLHGRHRRPPVVSIEEADPEDVW